MGTCHTCSDGAFDEIRVTTLISKQVRTGNKRKQSVLVISLVAYYIAIEIESDCYLGAGNVNTI